MSLRSMVPRFPLGAWLATFELGRRSTVTRVGNDPGVRIAYLVDVHDRFAAVPEALGRIGAVDLLVIGGDITTGGTARRAGRAINGWRALVPRLLAVAGNMDSPAIDARLDELGVALDQRGI